MIVIAKAPAYTALVKKLEELLPLFQKEGKMAEFKSELYLIKASQKNRPKCIAMLNSFAQQHNL